MTYDPSQIFDALVRAGARPDQARTLTGIAGAESGFGANNVSGQNRNGSRDYGVFQINNSAWPQYGGANVNKMSLDQQAAAALHIANTQGPGAWTTYKNGAFAKFVPPGTTLNSVPMDPSIAARGGVSALPVTASTQTSAPTPSLGQNLQKGDVGAALAQLTANKTDSSGKEQPGTSALSKLAGLAEPKQQAQQPSAPMLQAPPDNTAAIAPAAQSLLASTLANAKMPLHWSTVAPGYGMAGPQVPGMTLNNSGYPNV